MLVAVLLARVRRLTRRRIAVVDDARIIIDPVTWLEVEVPIYATDTAAIEKEHRRREGRISSLILEPEYGCGVPLWDRSGPVDLESYGVSRKLRDDLSAWLSFWEDNFHYEHGWASAVSRKEWSERGEDLYGRLCREVWELADVKPEFRKFTTT